MPPNDRLITPTWSEEPIRIKESGATVFYTFEQGEEPLSALMSTYNYIKEFIPVRSLCISPSKSISFPASSLMIRLSNGLSCRTTLAPLRWPLGSFKTEYQSVGIRDLEKKKSRKHGFLFQLKHYQWFWGSLAFFTLLFSYHLQNWVN